MTTIDKKQIRVVIVDDHTMIRTGLRMLIENEAGMSVVGEASNRVEAVDVVKREKPDIIILDVDLAGESSLDAMPDLLAGTSGKAHVLMLTGVRDVEVHARAAQLGARGLVLKEKASEVLIKAIQRVHEGEIWFDRAMMSNLLMEMTRRKTEKEDPEAAKIMTLTDREREIITLIGEGLKNKQIAERLFISETTVRHHLTSIYGKLEITDRLELFIYAYRHGLISPPETTAR